MNARRLEIALWSATGLLVIVAALRAVPRLAAADPRADDMILPARAVAQRPAPSAERLQSAVNHDPFRLERHPSPIAYKPELEGVAAPPPPPKPPRPQLVLAGILGGPPWEALLEGLPDKTGSVVVHAGDVFGDLKVRSVTRDSVIIRGADTTWRLGIKGSWQ